MEQACFFFKCSVDFFKMLFSCLISIQLLFILKFEDFKIFSTIAYEISLRVLNGQKIMVSDNYFKEMFFFFLKNKLYLFLTFPALCLYSHFLIAYLLYIVSQSQLPSVSLLPLNELFSAPQLGITWKKKMDYIFLQSTVSGRMNKWCQTAISGYFICFIRNPVTKISSWQFSVTNLYLLLQQYWTHSDL